MSLNGIVMVTDGGPHSAEDWADATAKWILPIIPATRDKPGTPQPMIGPIEDFRKVVIEILLPHHAGVQEGERANLEQNGDDHLETPHDAEAETAAAVAAIVAASRGTPLESHIAKPEVQAVMADEIGRHFRTAQHIHRHWYCDDHETAQAWRAANGLPDAAPSDAARTWKAQHHG